MDEPVMLQHFVKARGSMGRNTTADFCHLLQFPAALIVLFDGSQIFQFLGMALGVLHNGMGRNFHGLEFFQLVVGCRIVQGIDVRTALFYVFEDVEHAFLKQLIACHRVSRSPLFHKFRKYAGPISI